MKKNKRKTPEALDDSTQVSAMIDIVFLLLIYFILTQKPIIEDTLLNFVSGHPKCTTNGHLKVHHL